jgi:hypothetical protein
VTAAASAANPWSWLRWVLAGVAAVVLALAAHGYVRERVADAALAARIRAADSVSTVETIRYAALADSGRRAAARAQAMADSDAVARAATAARAFAAEAAAGAAAQTAARLRDSLAAHPVLVAMVDSLTVALGATTAALRADSAVIRHQAFTIDSLSAGQKILLRGLADGQATITQQRTEIGLLQNEKTPTHSVLWHVGDVSIKIAALTAAALIGHAL